MATLSVKALDAAAMAVCDLIAGGSLCIYGGSVELAELRFTRFSDVSHGAITAELTSEENAKATGKATRFEARSPYGETIIEGSVGTTKMYDLIMDSADIEVGGIVNVTSFVYRQST